MPGSGPQASMNRLALVALPPVFDNAGTLSPAASGAKAPVKLAPEPEPEVADCVRVGAGVWPGSLVATPGRVPTQRLIAPLLTEVTAIIGLVVKVQPVHCRFSVSP